MCERTRIELLVTLRNDVQPPDEGWGGVHRETVTWRKALRVWPALYYH